MCGIVGYVGPQQALTVVIEGLRRLEYRGYDSAGVAVVADNTSQQLAPFIPGIKPSKSNIV